MNKKSEVAAAKAFFANWENSQEGGDDAIFLKETNCEDFIVSLGKKLGLNILQIKPQD